MKTATSLSRGQAGVDDVLIRVDGGAQQQRLGLAGVPTLPPGARSKSPLPSIWNGAKVLPCAAVLPGTAKMSAKSSLPLGEIRFCEGEVSMGNVTVEPGIGVSEPSRRMRKPVMLGATVPGVADGRIAPVGHVQLVAGDADAVRLYAAGVERTDQMEGAIGVDAERADRVAALVDGEEETAVGRGYYLLAGVIGSDDLGEVDLACASGVERAELREAAVGFWWKASTAF